jgi:zinc/manganese transport system substrate-binding protein
MVLGGIFSGILMGLFSTITSKTLGLNEDASFAGYYLIATAWGVTLLSLYQKNVDLSHILFGSVLGMTPECLYFIAGSSCIIILIFLGIYRSLVYECCDPLFFKLVGGWGGTIQFLFLSLVTLNLVTCFQALGTLMALGLMILPAITARIFFKKLWCLCLGSVFLGILGSYLGLVFSFHWDIPSGPAIVLVLGSFYMLALVGCNLQAAQKSLRGWVGSCLCKKTTQTIASKNLMGIFWFLCWNTLFVTHQPIAHELNNLQEKIEQNPLNIVVSFTILKDLVEQIGGPYVKVVSLVGYNGNPHNYEPKPSDGKLLAKADLVVVNGWGFEGWIARLIQASGYNKKILEATQGLFPKKCASFCFPHRKNQCTECTSNIDPHGWHSIPITQHYVLNIKNALCNLNPKQKSFFEKQYRLYYEKLGRLHKKLSLAFNKVPPEKRIILSSHSGFEYYGTTYHIRFLALLGTSADGMPSAQSIAKLIRLIQNLKVRSIFFENMSNPALIQTIAQETNLTLKGPLYSDSLSTPNGPAGTYIDLMSYNSQLFLQSFR